jgi:hypothetical protein
MQQRPLQRFESDTNLASNLEFNKEGTFETWRYGLKKWAAEKNDAELIYFYRRCAWIVKLYDDKLSKEFKDAMFDAVPVPLLEDVYLESQQDRIREYEMEVAGQAWWIGKTGYRVSHAAAPKKWWEFWK